MASTKSSGAQSKGTNYPFSLCLTCCLSPGISLAIIGVSFMIEVTGITEALKYMMIIDIFLIITLLQEDAISSFPATHASF